MRETPDIETSSDGYASRFAGEVGRYMLSVQEEGLLSLMEDGNSLFGRTVLDIGGGHAQLSRPLFSRGCRVAVAGSDVICADRLSKLQLDIPFYEGDLTHLPVPDRAFDTVVSVRLISHMDNWKGLVAELCRIADHTVIIDYPTYASSNLLSILTFPLKKMIEKNTRTYRSFWDRQIYENFARHGFYPTREYRQFILPMALHRFFGKSGGLQRTENLLRRIGITRLLGNPVLLRLDRRGS
jgi:2-polyprenyl-3-methyl-5-hydroxy-6-metoxy-1,4-benzoquinol methylase